jgi:SAM-dependent methyltransferase
LAEIDDTRRSYDLVAERYAAEIGSELAGKPIDRALLLAFADLTAAGPVVDVGCGPGHVSEFLAAAGARTFGLDLSFEMCALARGSGSIPVGSADMTRLPVRSESVAGIVCMYAVIHLNPAQRAAAYTEFQRVLQPGGYLLVAFHVSDADVPIGGSRSFSEWWDFDVNLTFRYLDPAAEIGALVDSGFQLMARTDRSPMPEVEHASQRSYLLLQKG